MAVCRTAWKTTPQMQQTIDQRICRLAMSQILPMGNICDKPKGSEKKTSTIAQDVHRGTRPNN